MPSPRFIICVIALATAVSPIRADDVTDGLDAAKTAYESGKFSEAIQSIDYAGQLIRQKKGEAVAKLLPAAPEGWTAEDSESDSQAAAVLGGMVSAKRTYRRESGGSVTIQIQSDSPILQSLGMMFSNPILLASSGAKLENIKGQKCAVTYKASNKGGDVKSIVDGRYLVSIEGSELSRDDLMVFAKAFDYSQLAGLK
jgi:hypothetical protein